MSMTKTNRREQRAQAQAFIEALQSGIANGIRKRTMTYQLGILKIR